MRIVTAKPPKKHLGGPVQRIEAEPAALPERPRIVTAHATTRFGPVQDIDAEEHERRGHVAEALRDPVRRATGDGGASRNATGAAMGMTHCRPAPRRRTNRSPRQDATAVESTGVETHFNRRDMLLREIIKRTSTMAAAAGLARSSC